ncbi:unnamed protein product [Adineta ricciae]|uniref:Uncharacterized protein n=1 Tax=Adineta ricciae TaxID=249248 RepID=A0A815ZPQ8_ADIRI|nr:unnamed protein product [Adineta ricciae]
MNSPSTSVIYGFFQSACSHPQKAAVELDGQMWTYGELLSNVICVASHLNIEIGQIVFQYVERSLEMICGILGILCAGGVYCSLNSDEPIKRTRTILDEVHGQFVLIHENTREKFLQVNSQQIKTIDLAEILSKKIPEEFFQKEFILTQENFSFIICTSGSTGKPKVVLHTHRSLAAHVLIRNNWQRKDVDKFLQLAASSWIIHVLEIFITLTSDTAATLVLLRPGDHLNTDRLYKTIKEKQVTIIRISSSMLKLLIDYMELTKKKDDDILENIRILCLGGDPPKIHYVLKLKFFMPNARIFFVYGLSEGTAAVGCYYEFTGNETMDGVHTLPIGYPQLGYKCLLINTDNKEIISSSTPHVIGELYIGGRGIFHCYYGNPELTEKTKMIINNERFFKSGDLAEYNEKGELVYIGRIDFQIKINGQRVEAGEIEMTIMNWSPDEITGCLVLKLTENDKDSLVAYLISKNKQINVESLRNYCRERLRQYMIPTHFLILNRFPLNTNGKIDRSQLPFPSENQLIEDLQNYEKPMNTLEEEIHSLWCSILNLQLFNHYQFHLAKDKQLNIFDFFNHPTIAEHAQFVENDQGKSLLVWKPLHLIRGQTSFAQERIWLDEIVRFQSNETKKLAIYNETLMYKVTSSSLSISRLRNALSLVIQQHSSLRTRISYENENLIQEVLPMSNELYEFEITIVKNENDIMKIIHSEETNSSLFNPSQGRVFRCHLLTYSSHDDYLHENDLLLFNFHHLSMDGMSNVIFIKSIQQAYKTQHLSDDLQSSSLTYLDYVQYERIEDMSNARHYWIDALKHLKTSHIPYNSSKRTGNGLTMSFQLDSSLVKDLFQFVIQSNLTLFQVGLTTFFIFLSKVFNEEKDDHLCTLIVLANRYRHELEKMIGLFANSLPFPIQMNSNETFQQMSSRVQQIWFQLLPHSHLPFQEIVKLYPSLGSLFTQTTFIVQSPTQNGMQNIELDENIQLELIERYKVAGNIAKLDFSCTLHEDRINETISISINASRDVYDQTTISTMAQRFQNLLRQIFSDLFVSQFSILLPEEQQIPRHDHFNNDFLFPILPIHQTVTQAPSSYVQNDFCLHLEKQQEFVANLPFIYRLSSGNTLSMKQLLKALQIVVLRHDSLRTSISFDKEKNMFIQNIINSNNNNEKTNFFTFIESIYETEKELSQLIDNEQNNSKLFHLNEGIVFRFHHISSSNFHSSDDILIFNFHHAIFDIFSMEIFFQDLIRAYTKSDFSEDIDRPLLQYIDYSVAEHRMSMNVANTFWLETLQDYDMNRTLSLPFDRYLIIGEQQIKHHISVVFFVVIY